MGKFHIICNVLFVIGKILRVAGLRDVTVEAVVITEDSTDSVLVGRQ